MDLAELAREIIATYRKHGWKLQRVLLRPETRAEITGSEGKNPGEATTSEQQSFEDVRIDEASIDALWFSRPSYGTREAWELRLLSETQYALFETFEKDEPEEAREEVRREIEARLLEYVTKR
jgi:hypothetical protein